jgi:hypothetical protein
VFCFKKGRARLLRRAEPKLCFVSPNTSSINISQMEIGCNLGHDQCLGVGFMTSLEVCLWGESSQNDKIKSVKTVWAQPNP